jgi:hypothetical protein
VRKQKTLASALHEAMVFGAPWRLGPATSWFVAVHYFVDSAQPGLIPKSDLPMRLTAARFAVPGKREAAVTMLRASCSDLRGSART